MKIKWREFLHAIHRNQRLFYLLLLVLKIFHVLSLILAPWHKLIENIKGTRERIIDIINFQSNLLKIEKKSYKDIDIYYIGYIAIEKFGDCNNIHSVNPLYLIIQSATGYFKEKNGEKHLIIDSTKKYEEVFSGIISETKTINCGEKLFYEENYAIIRVNNVKNVIIKNVAIR